MSFTCEKDHLFGSILKNVSKKFFNVTAKNFVLETNSITHTIWKNRNRKHKKSSVFLMFILGSCTMFKKQCLGNSNIWKVQIMSGWKETGNSNCTLYKFLLNGFALLDESFIWYDIWISKQHCPQDNFVHYKVIYHNFINYLLDILCLMHVVMPRVVTPSLTPMWNTNDFSFAIISLGIYGSTRA